MHLCHFLKRNFREKILSIFIVFPMSRYLLLQLLMLVEQCVKLPLHGLDELLYLIGAPSEHMVV